MERVINSVTKTITILKADINFKTGVILLRIKEKLEWTNTDSSKASSITIGTMEITYDCSSLQNTLETYIGTDPVLEPLDSIE